MSQASDDTPTGPIASANPDSVTVRDSAPDPVRKRNAIRDQTAATLVVIALFFPWNLYFGWGIPGSSRSLFVVLALATMLSLAALAVTYVGPWKLSGTRFNPVLLSRLRLGLNVPYLLLLLGFVAYDVFETIRTGGTVHMPGGVGPGGWLGIAGSVLAAQPAIASPTAGDGEHRGWLSTAQIVGCSSIAAAALGSGYNLYWRVRYALPDSNGSAEFGKQNIAVIVTAVVYGAAALAAVLVASRWLLQGTKAARFTILMLGASTLVSGIIVWSIPVGREIDAFHGIAQNTSTAGVGYEGYLAWAASAAIFVPLATFNSSSQTSSTDKDGWRAATRNGLLLIVVWCLSSVAMRITDLGVAVTLNFPFSRYDTMTLAAFDLFAALLALWLRVNLLNTIVPARIISSLCGLLAALTVARVILGIALAPRFQESPAVSANPVYGNNLAQQITSTFDVVLCGLALCIVAAVVVSGRQRPLTRPPRHPRRGPTSVGNAPTKVLSSPAPRIFRSAARGQQLRPKIFRPPDKTS